MTVAEREQIAAVALGLTDPAKTVVVGVTDTCLQDSLRLARHAQEHGARGVLCASPFYFPNSTTAWGAGSRSSMQPSTSSSCSTTTRSRPRRG